MREIVNRNQENQEREAGTASFFESESAAFRDRILADLAEVKESLRPKVLNRWENDNKPQILLVELPHSDPAADPKVSCNGRIITKINFNQDLRVRQTVCQECEQEVEVNLTVLKLELKLL